MGTVCGRQFQIFIAGLDPAIHRAGTIPLFKMDGRTGKFTQPA
jgi:hypothetical protein